MWPKFTEEMLNGKLHFLGSVWMSFAEMNSLLGPAKHPWRNS